MKDTPTNDIELSVTTAVYQAETFIDEFYRRASLAAASVTPHYEIVFVNDGSRDKSLERLLAIQQQDPKVVVVDLSRNFGQPNAVRTALEYARGKLVFPIDDDLEEDPEWLGLFHTVMREQSADVVFGVQQKRKGKIVERFFGNAFYFLMQRIFRIECTRDIVTARLMTRRYVDAMLAHKEYNFEISIIGHRIGFKRATVPVTKHSIGTSSYSFWKKVKYVEDYVTSGSTVPLVWIILAGVACLGIAGLLFVMFMADWILHYHQTVFYGRLTLASIWFIGGAVLTALGIVGLYTAQIANQVKGRPLAVVRDVWPASRSTEQRPLS